MCLGCAIAHAPLPSEGDKLWRGRAAVLAHGGMPETPKRKPKPQTMKNRILASLITTLAVGLAQRGAAVDFHMTTAQKLQNALTLAAANGAHH